jgi:hypothetical protein
MMGEWWLNFKVALSFKNVASLSPEGENPEANDEKSRLYRDCPAITILSPGGLYAQAVHRDIRTPQYRQLQEKLANGWNTWYNNSVASEVLLPEAFSINLCFSRPGSEDYLNQIFKASENAKRPETVKLGLRSDDGYYTSMQLKYKGEDFHYRDCH